MAWDAEPDHDSSAERPLAICGIISIHFFWSRSSSAWAEDLQFLRLVGISEMWRQRVFQNMRNDLLVVVSILVQ